MPPRTRRRLVAVVAVTAALVLCFVGSGRTGSGGTVASDFGRTTAAAATARAHPGPGEQLTEDQEEVAMGGRRLLSGGPGSHPPRCTSKCGSCSPCYPVHVSVPPGVLVTTEYYPEAWRCKCQNQLYMP